MPGNTRSIRSDDRLVLSAIAERLIFDDAETFNPEDARELARLLPVTPAMRWLSRLWPDVVVSGSLPGRSAAGFAAGVGNASFKEDGPSFSLDSRGRRVVRAGQWKLIRIGGNIEIEQVMADDSDEGRTARVDFRRGEPVRMCLLATVGFAIGPLHVSTGRFRPWKVPARDCGAGS
jgi:hypothetical protein